MPHAGPHLTNLVATDLFQMDPTLFHRQALWPALREAKPSPVAGAQKERGPRLQGLISGQSSITLQDTQSGQTTAQHWASQGQRRPEDSHFSFIRAKAF